jgi:hypothetical protein
MRFVPEERKNESMPCWFIPLGATGETIDSHSRYGTQQELEAALGDWLRSQTRSMEEERARRVEPTAGAHYDEVCKLAGT